MKIELSNISLNLSEDQISELKQKLNITQKLAYSYEEIKTEFDVIKVMNYTIEQYNKLSIRDKIVLVCKCLCENVKIDFRNHNQNKYYPVYNIKSSCGSVGFSGSCCSGGSTYGQVSYVDTYDKVLHLDKYFRHLYIELINSY